MNIIWCSPVHILHASISCLTVRRTVITTLKQQIQTERFMVLLPNTRSSQIPWKYEIKNLESLRLRTVSAKSTRRPEHSVTDNFYDKHEVKRYLSNDKNMRIQKEMTFVAVDLLEAAGLEKCFVLDLGCGACISGEVLEERGHRCTGIDRSLEMLKRRRRACLDVIKADIFQPLPFRDASFDGAISISTLQWAFSVGKCVNLRLFVHELSRVLRPRGSAIVQFYPANSSQVEAVLNACEQRFIGALVVEQPHRNQAKKLFLSLISKLQNVD